MSRSTKKGPAIDAKLMKKVEALNRSGEKAVIKTWSRWSTVMPQMVGLTIGVHDGRRHVPIYITEKWWGTSWASLPQPGPSGGMAPRRRRRPQPKTNV